MVVRLAMVTMPVVMAMMPILLATYPLFQRWVIAIKIKIQLPNTLPITFKLCNWYYQLKLLG
jgi:hypothetical protein